MKKTFFLLLISVLLFSCEQESEDSIKQETNLEEIIGLDDGIFSFKNWEEYGELYSKFGTLSMEELEEQSFFSDKKNLNVSAAINGILNDNNQFIVAGKIIWFHQNKFYEIEDGVDVQKLNLKNLKEVGSVSNTVINSDSEASSIKGVITTNQHEFKREKYIDRCGSGTTWGSLPRPFKYVHEIVQEHMRVNATNYYSLILKVKLEYNEKRRKWRQAGDKREIIISLTNNNSFLGNINGPASGTVDINERNIQRNWSCTSDEEIVLTRIIVHSSLPSGYSWKTNIKGTITEKIIGDTVNNRWTDRVNW